MRARRQRQKDLFETAPTQAPIPAECRKALINLLQTLLSEAMTPPAETGTAREDAHEPD